MTHSAQYTDCSRDPAATVAVTGAPDARLACGCEVGAHYDASLRFYVSCCEHVGGRHLLLLGPFPDHCAALAAVDDGRRFVDAIGDPKACWYHYGTCSIETDESARVVFRPDGTLRRDPPREPAPQPAAVEPAQRRRRSRKAKGGASV